MSKKEKKSENTFKDFKTATIAAVNIGGNALMRKNGLSGITTGLSSIDNKIGGLQKSSLVIVAGGTAMGKSTLATNIAFNTALAYKKDRLVGTPHGRNSGASVGFFSLESSDDRIANTILALRANLSPNNMRHGIVTQEDFNKLFSSSPELDDLPLFINDSPNLSINAIKTQARNLCEKEKLGLIIIDYIQLIRYDNSYLPSSSDLSEITRELKALAMELEIPIIVFSQINENLDVRENNRPNLADLHKFGSIEEHSDIVAFLHRPEYYHLLKEPDPWTPDYEKWNYKYESIVGLAEFIIAKQRHGSTGIIELQFEAETSKFSDRPLSPNYHAEKH